MIETVYRDLAEFGLPFITPEAPTYALRLREIQNAPRPFGLATDALMERAAVLENQTQSAIIILSYVWRYTSATGETRTSRYSNLGSSMQMDVLTGREKAVRDLSTFILPGARRLITEHGIFGDNSAVPGIETHCGRGGGWSGRGSGREVDWNDVMRIVLELDVAILEDGLCLGRDETGLRQSLTEQMETQSHLAGEMVKALRDGLGRGPVFEMLRPVARHTRPAPPSIGHSFSPLLSIFANASINQLINADDPGLLAWFEAAAAISPLRLHPPEQ